MSCKYKNNKIDTTFNKSTAFVRDFLGSLYGPKSIILFTLFFEYAPVKVLILDICSDNFVPLATKFTLKTAKGNQYRFCDLLSSHVMRRTAITTLLILGMPEPLVKKISGHSPNSKEFYKYVKYSDSFLDDETDKAFGKLIP